MAASLGFSAYQINALNGLCHDLSTSEVKGFKAIFGQTDDGTEHWAAVIATAFVNGIELESEPLATVLVGEAVEGPAAVMSPGGYEVTANLQFGEAVDMTRRLATNAVGAFLR
ncbi:hypothetical protein [Xylophilus sp. GOD-11R]|uniref:hypothetical protein n=1 Tax=Xylophilus sp. GOD-11R TaxID=3089814 RepID=UPI00298D4006|nr:hypothetical protein [Xylophilus sp. GOD-11R]WPB58726.1 hypothetical protein R9X41_08835 [Xylophilus sp. GOD-11R]